MRTELRTNGQTQTYGRLSRLRSAIQSAINSVVEVRAQQAPDEFYAGLANLEQRADQWGSAGGAYREGVGTYDSGGTSGISSNRGTDSANQGGFGGASGNP